MRKSAFLTSLSLMVGACGQRPPSAYQHTRDQILAMVPVARAIDEDLTPCYRTIAGKPGSLSDQECYRFGKAQHMRGVWAHGFEEDGFYPAIASPPSSDAPTDFWLEMNPRALSSGMEQQVSWRVGETRYVHLDFIGRRTVVPGGYGHLGGTKHLIIVDRILHLKALN